LGVKASVEELGIFGGPPAFRESLHVGRPNIGSRERLFARLNEILDNRWLTNRGPFEKEFEQRLADYTGAKHVIAICNGTVALEIAVRALELKGEVIVPAFTFVATAHALQFQEITPVFCDVDPATHNLTPDRLEEMITPRTTGIIGVHTWGRPCDVDRITAIARKRKLRLLFDAAHAFGCSYNGRSIGNFGDAEVFSFHATKCLNTFEGGAIATNDDEVAKRARLMRNFGFVEYDTVIYCGTNGKMTEIQAAMGLTSLESFEEFVKANEVNYRRYKERLKGIPGLRLTEYSERDRTNYHYISVDVDASVTGLSRDTIVQVLHKENVLVRRYFYPGVHKMEPYRSLFPHAKLLLPQTERLVLRMLTLPTGTAVSTADIDRVCELLRFVVANASEINAWQRRGRPLAAVQA
jgi:dTDP-4-amino-4,6-dideoxygalactose transaminase